MIKNNFTMIDTDSCTFGVLDDEVVVREDLQDVLTRNFRQAQVHLFANSQELYSYFDQGHTLDVLLLDLMLEGESGEDVLMNLRRPDSRYLNMPIAIVTGKDRGNNIHEILNFERGCNEYFYKPYSELTMVARLRRLLETSKKINSMDPQDDEGVLVFGDLRIDGGRFQAFYAGKDIGLTNKEFLLLQYLAANKEKVQSRPRLLRKVWDYEFTGDDRTVDVTVSRTNRKLLDATGHRYIGNRRGSGYYFADPESLRQQK